MRCPAAHAPAPLVVVARRTVERELVEGFAGCPVCHLEATVKGGDVVFPGAEGAEDAPRTSSSGSSADASAARDRLVALLGLAEEGGAVLLTGRYVPLAAALRAVVDVAVICLNVKGPAAEGVSAVHLATPGVPFADATFRGAALDPALDAETVQDALRTVLVGGRVLGAHPLPILSMLKELARDDQEWLGERQAGPSGVIPLRRA